MPARLLNATLKHRHALTSCQQSAVVVEAERPNHCNLTSADCGSCWAAICGHAVLKHRACTAASLVAEARQLVAFMYSPQRLNV